MQKRLPLLCSLVLLFLLSACAEPIVIVVTATPTANAGASVTVTPLPPTPTSTTESATSTPVPTQTPTSMPTWTPVPPTPTPVPTPQRISFAPGATSATVTGRVTFPVRDQYLLRALAGQVMSVQISSPGNLANFSIVGTSDGTPYKRVENEDRSFTFTLPSTQDYLITVAVPSGSVDYTLDISVVTPPRPEPRERVNFAPGATSATRTGVIRAGLNVKEYILGAAAGQTMTVNVTSSGAPIDITIAAFATDSVLARSGGTTAFNSASTGLPATTDYVVILDTPLAAGDTNFTVEFIIESTPAPPPAPPERVNFDPGATSAARSGIIEASVNLKQYILRAGAGQTMTVNVYSDGAPIDIVVALYGTDGALVQSGASASFNSVTTGLPATTDYVVVLRTAAAATDTNYTVEFIIE